MWQPSFACKLLGTEIKCIENRRKVQFSTADHVKIIGN
jgi:hypothetical protein